jgi:general secretion pathway protein D
MAQDGKMSQIQVMQEEYYMMTPPGSFDQYAYSRAELEQISSGTKLEITPHVGDNNDITLQISVEVSDSIPQGRGSDLPVVTRRTADNNVTVKNGGTVALAGLSENRTRSSRKRVPGLSNLPLVGELFKNSDDDTASREIAVFVTAHLVPHHGQAPVFQSTEPAPAIQAPTGYPMGQGQGQSFRDDLRRSLSRPVR